MNDELEQLRAENRRLNDTLGWVTSQCPGRCGSVTHPVAALAARLQPVPALVYELLYAEHRADPVMRWFEYGTIADRILVTLADRPDIAVRLRSILPRPPCERCGASGARPTAVRTAYSWADNGGINPNHPMQLCPPCTEEYNEHWDGMWADYYAGLS